MTNTDQQNKVTITTVKYKDWEFEVDRELTRQTYNNVSVSGAESCVCNDCKNYVVYRDNVFPEEIKGLFEDFGIDYKKEVEITSYETLQSGLHHIGGWFHFKGKLLKGKSYRVPVADNADYAFDLTEIEDNFSIGFAPGNDLAHFADKKDLIQVEFMTFIPWVIDKSLETQ